jgi:hypothetical protein
MPDKQQTLPVHHRTAGMEEEPVPVCKQEKSGL